MAHIFPHPDKNFGFILVLKQGYTAYSHIILYYRGIFVGSAFLESQLCFSDFPLSGRVMILDFLSLIFGLVVFC